MINLPNCPQTTHHQTRQLIKDDSWCLVVGNLHNPPINKQVNMNKNTIEFCQYTWENIVVWKCFSDLCLCFAWHCRVINPFAEKKMLLFTPSSHYGEGSWPRIRLRAQGVPDARGWLGYTRGYDFPESATASGSLKSARTELVAKKLIFTAELVGKRERKN